MKVEKIESEENIRKEADIDLSANGAVSEESEIDFQKDLCCEFSLDVHVDKEDVVEGDKLNELREDPKLRNVLNKLREATEGLEQLTNSILEAQQAQVENKRKIDKTWRTH